MNLPNIIRPEHTFIGVSAPTKWRALQTIADKAAMAFSVDARIILKALEAREKLGSTGIGNGIAIPHAAIDGMSTPRGLLLRFSRPLDFEAIDDIPADIAVVLLFGENNRGEYLNVLSAHRAAAAIGRRTRRHAQGKDGRRILFRFHRRLTGVTKARPEGRARSSAMRRS
ncbi:protein-N(pi)-phosphohistidine-sugar phosphotransferase protein (enzyme II of thephosphotransferase system) (plasmid) [Rhizobium etli CFN 42]|uniref:Protein-N(Pi)-phosphohistidine-sugar phosphotransferase protein (Enzyme II of thephosphotransferase system) n=1 Tax=Rhizobium etli (strain ATCC 51251 / DSM 11541 / JCM 21823 / NBRC 15573 / CFN 42) TaxID=347834 RepID=Q2K0Q2_RHIEC|nr:protein-N(pi)-phosphohistidine-sugar phosphotransferase protein (enzyme II of thephosphotransferase system) [Rhizobium etli CFN 42]